MVYYTADGRKLTEEEALKGGDYIVFNDEAAAVKHFDNKAAEANTKANPGFFQPQGVADRASHAYMNLANKPGEDSGPNPNTILEGYKQDAGVTAKSAKRVSLQNQFERGEITALELRKAMDDLDNPASGTFGKVE